MFTKTAVSIIAPNADMNGQAPKAAETTMAKPSVMPTVRN